MITRFSDCKKYRYTLVRKFHDVPKPNYLIFLMLNPSKADEIADDPTIKRCISFAKQMGYDGLLVLNCYAYRSTDARQLKLVADPIGPENDNYIKSYASLFPDVICAWGNNAEKHRAASVVKILKEVGAKMWCFKINGTGHPKHPLFVSSNQEPIPFEFKYD